MKFLALFSLIAPLAAAAVVGDKPVSYDGYKVFRIDTHGEGDQVEKLLKGLKAVPYSCNAHEHLEVAVAPEDVPKFEKLGFDFDLLLEDLGKAIKEEGGFFPDSGRKAVSSLSDLSATAFPDLTWFNAYHPFADHQQWLVDVQAGFTSNSELFEVGKSYQGRPINGIHLWGNGGKGSKPAVYWHGTVHAREWVTTMVVEYLTYQLITGYQRNDTAVKTILDKYDFYILPVVNPDGFVYTQTTNRLWRKNRVPHPSNSCVGTDMNRNWPYQWSVTGGSSTDPCSETFRGTAAGSTPEITALVKFSQTLAAGKGIKSYIDWHSFSQLILLPYGYDCNRQVSNYQYQIGLAQGTASAVRGVHGTRFTSGATCPTLYKAVGGSTDWMQDVGKAQVSWCIELRPSSGGSSGFVLPASQIKPSGEEMWQGMLYLLPTM
ncbi:hypothetical protein ABW19_dt0206783 [Dactylella cylindrospora]|nr:hypothetical protein ABW19_dt0206783 [Dactylella cylindrospora]